MRIVMPLVTSLLFVALVGCGKTEPAVDATAAHEAGHSEGEHGEAGHSKAAHEGHSHGGWWCNEHGVPEEVCALCDPKLVADFKAKGDWCAEHDRPDSQCFRCHPELEQKFAAQYEAKYGKKPPKPSDES